MSGASPCRTSFPAFCIGLFLQRPDMVYTQIALWILCRVTRLWKSPPSKIETHCCPRKFVSLKKKHTARWKYFLAKLFSKKFLKSCSPTIDNPLCWAGQIEHRISISGIKGKKVKSESTRFVLLTNEHPGRVFWSALLCLSYFIRGFILWQLWSPQCGQTSLYQKSGNLLERWQCPERGIAKTMYSGKVATSEKWQIGGMQNLRIWIRNRVGTIAIKKSGNEGCGKRNLAKSSKSLSDPTSSPYWH